MDNEARIQEDNPLRTIGGNRAVISSLGLFYRPPLARNFDLSLQVDNLWNTDFQEVPAVPAARRQIAAGVNCRW
jgi:outer membrane receptor protein involved in Fe transport